MGDESCLPPRCRKVILSTASTYGISGSASFTWWGPLVDIRPNLVGPIPSPPLSLARGVSMSTEPVFSAPSHPRIAPPAPAAHRRTGKPPHPRSSGNHQQSVPVIVDCGANLVGIGGTTANRHARHSEKHEILPMIGAAQTGLIQGVRYGLTLDTVPSRSGPSSPLPFLPLSGPANGCAI